MAVLRDSENGFVRSVSLRWVVSNLWDVDRVFVSTAGRAAGDHGATLLFRFRDGRSVLEQFTSFYVAMEWVGKRRALRSTRVIVAAPIADVRGACAWSRDAFGLFQRDSTTFA